MNSDSRLQSYIEAVDAFSKITHESLLLVDFQSEELLYTSDSMQLLIDKYREMSGSPSQEQTIVFPRYFDKLRGQFHRIASFFSQHPEEDKKKWTVDLNVCLYLSSKKIQINHTIIPLTLTTEGKVHLGICTLNIPVRNIPERIVLYKKESYECYIYSSTDKTWTLVQIPELTEHEKDTLFLHMQGYNEQEISELMCKSKDSIRYYKRHIFEKLEVNSIIPAIGIAIRYHLLTRKRKPKVKRFSEEK